MAKLEQGLGIAVTMIVTGAGTLPSTVAERFPTRQRNNGRPGKHLLLPLYAVWETRLAKRRRGMRQAMRSSKAGRRLALVLMLAVVSSSIVAVAQASEPTVLKDLPSAQAVLGSVHGQSQADTSARQYATFDQLISIIGELKGPDEFTPSPLESDYRAEIGRLAGLPNHTVWMAAALNYEANTQFNSDLLKRYFPPAVAAAYTKTHHANIAASRRKAAQKKAAEKRAAEQGKQSADPGFPLRAKIVLIVLAALVGLCGGGRWVWVYVR